jgi:hypothetical protein
MEALDRSNQSKESTTSNSVRRCKRSQLPLLEAPPAGEQSTLGDSMLQLTDSHTNQSNVAISNQLHQTIVALSNQHHRTTLEHDKRVVVLIRQK